VNYYNEIDPYCAKWLQNLMDAGHIAQGIIDTRSIEDVTPADLAGYTQCHFFAGIGGWALALRLAGWPDSRPAWSGSCPCQPFSAAGKGSGFDDKRHLWPAWQHLIAQCRPAVVFGEQVASKAVDAWIDLVHADLEGMGYAFGGIAFPAAGIGAPHIRDRTYWVGHTDSARLERHTGYDSAAGREGSQRSATSAGVSVRMADADGWNASPEREQCSGEQRQLAKDRGAGGMGNADSDGAGRIARALRGAQAGEGRRGCGNDAVASGVANRPVPTNGQWRNADWLGCTDGKWRPVEPGSQPLAYGIPGRVGRLRAYGNAIVPAQAAEFVRAYGEARGLMLAELEQAA
jgi:DNA (cytosine-5)-methyltransferase 1